MGRLPWRRLGPLVALCALHQAAQRSGLAWRWADAWLDDLLCLPLALALTLALQRRLRVRDDAYVLPVLHVAAAWLFFSVVFEALLPVWTAGQTADPRDVAAYAAGAVVFQVWINRPVVRVAVPNEVSP